MMNALNAEIVKRLRHHLSTPEGKEFHAAKFQQGSPEASDALVAQRWDYLVSRSDDELNDLLSREKLSDAELVLLN